MTQSRFYTLAFRAKHCRAIHAIGQSGHTSTTVDLEKLRALLADQTEYDPKEQVPAAWGGHNQTLWIDLRHA